MTSFVALAIFDCLNAYLGSGNSELGREHFLFYCKVPRSSGNNMIRAKPSLKKGKKNNSEPTPKKNKGEAIPGPTDREYYKR